MGPTFVLATWVELSAKPRDGWLEAQIDYRRLKKALA
jgi:hypothetical protein